MYAFIVKRILVSVPVIGVVVAFVFLLLHLSPGDPAAMIAGEYAKPEDIARIRHQLGLDRPLLEQFVGWLGRLLNGDLGVSIFTQKPVTELIGQRLEPTLALCVTTMLLTITLAVPLGVLSAWKAGTWLDRGVMALAVVGFSVPVFIFAYLLIYAFSLELRLFPVQGYADLRNGFGPFIHRLVLPSITLTVILTALLARITRTSMLEILGEDFIRTAYAKGLSDRKVLFRHALKNAAIPIVTVIGFSVVLLIGGVVVTESVYNIPGLGRLTVDSVLRRDYPVIQGLILVFSLSNVVINLLIDILYTAIDPRIRY
jgi:peptide/nickel transport system permease protein